MKEILNQLYQHKRLSKEAVKRILTNIAEEKYNDAHLTSFMTVFRMRPITANELVGFREALKELAIQVDFSEFETIEIVGTGGDGKDTFNISILSSFVVAGTRQKVAKHGNYSVSSKSGSSDMLESFGYEFTNDQDSLKRQLEKANLCFLHAPKFHPAIKAVGPTRKALKLKSFFNILEPLVNPSSPKNSVLRTFNLEVVRLYHYILQEEELNYGIVHALDGYDKISLTSQFKLFTKEGEQLIHPEDLDQQRILQSDIFGGDSIASAAKIFKMILEGNGTDAQNRVVLTNAVFALKIVDAKKSFLEAYEESKESLFGGKAKRCLEKLITN